MNVRKPVLLVFLTTLWVVNLLSPAARAAQASCESLAQLALDNTKITLAGAVTSGAFTPAPAPSPIPGPPATIKDLPAFCRVVAEVSATSDSLIKIEVWMPVEGWNGKYQGQDNGGFAGLIGYPAMGAAIKRGYATAGTDTGHVGFDAAWALGHPEKVIDFGYRGIHEMTLKAKAIIDAFYGQHLQRSYFIGCSDGGREALMEAQRFPEDYDGIIAGAPANYWTHLMVGAMWVNLATLVDQASYIPAEKLPAIGAAVIAACDAQDGVKDGILTDPRQCQFDPSTMLCKGADANSCLTESQVTALKKIYSGPVDSAGRQLFPGYLRGAEEGPGGWTPWITGRAPGQDFLFFFGKQYFSNMVYEQAAWDYKTFNIDQATNLAEEKTGRALNAIDPNLKQFRARGDKLIIYHGWGDAAIPASSTVNYYQSVVGKLGQRKTDKFVRFYLLPGMQHCGGGPGANSFGQRGNAPPFDPEHNIYSALEKWVEQGVPPGRIITTKYVDDAKPEQGVKMTRPLCAYPEVAKYKGSGDTNDAANFVCAPGNR